MLFRSGSNQIICSHNVLKMYALSCMSKVLKSVGRFYAIRSVCRFIPIITPGYPVNIVVSTKFNGAIFGSLSDVTWRLFYVKIRLHLQLISGATNHLNCLCVYFMTIMLKLGRLF